MSGKAISRALLGHCLVEAFFKSTSHIPINIPHPTSLTPTSKTSHNPNIPNSPSLEYHTSPTLHITNIPHALHPISPTFHIPNISHFEHLTSPISCKPNIPHFQHTTSPTFHITRILSSLSTNFRIHARESLNIHSTLFEFKTDGSQ